MTLKAYIRRMPDGARMGWGGVIRDTATGAAKATIPPVASWDLAIEHAAIILRNLNDPDLYRGDYPVGISFWGSKQNHGRKLGPGPYGTPPGPASRDGFYDPTESKNSEAQPCRTTATETASKRATASR